MALPRALGATLLPRCAGVLQQSVGASASTFSPLASVNLCRRFAADAAEAGDDTIEVEVREYKAHHIEPPGTTVTTTKAELMQMFETMYRMRRMEIAADMLYKSKLIRGFCHLYDGQEAVIVGLEAASTYQDSIITSYRDHCTHLGRGGTVFDVIAELMGRVEGATKGMGGSMHMYNKAHNFYGGCGIVGAQVPLGAGLGYAHKYRKDGSVAYALYGDGAANQGQIFEAFNMAGLWDLPVIFICENNHYGMGTAEWRGSKSSAFYTRGDYIPGLKIDGMDALAVKHGVAHAKAYAVEHGPIILEMDTYRYHGHSMSDPGSTYRTRDEITQIRTQRDPVEHIRKLLLDRGLAEASDLKKVEKSVKKEVDDAVEKAKQGTIPPADMLWKNIYSDPLGSVMRGMDSQTKIALS
ncbi:Pyruvate dehydrogenase E1 component subunit alpha-1, mitochondrial [Coccomyxa sp. Obi]|nr:Pyruvate dehydrogenase E1 component subunit alpha-1, mitochondrial [Coccomyxa sp. Obi]